MGVEEPGGRCTPTRKDEPLENIKVLVGIYSCTIARVVLVCVCFCKFRISCEVATTTVYTRSSRRRSTEQHRHVRYHMMSYHAKKPETNRPSMI